MKKIILLFLLNIFAVYGAMETKVLDSLRFGENLDFLVGILAISVFGLFSLELYKNRKNLHQFIAIWKITLEK